LRGQCRGDAARPRDRSHQRARGADWRRRGLRLHPPPALFLRAQSGPARLPRRHPRLRRHRLAARRGGGGRGRQRRDAHVALPRCGRSPARRAAADRVDRVAGAMILGLFAAVAVAAPLLMLRRRALWRCLAAELVALLVFGALAAFARVLRVTVDPYLALVAAGAVVLAIVCGFVALAEEVRWSANRAALLALLFYVLMIPLMLRTPIDGDEPFYLLITESIVHDHDLDLGNQFRDIARTA